jgi:hypothetical protein
MKAHQPQTTFKQVARRSIHLTHSNRVQKTGDKCAMLRNTVPCGDFATILLIRFTRSKLQQNTKQSQKFNGIGEE